ncbi:hypothetical protein GS461_18980 [Rhodococcus hoagii]|nr:hypothetical protein [Prescottella equi]
MAGLFFALSNRSRVLLSNFFDKLREDRKLEETLALARELPAEDPIRSKLHAALALEFTHADPAVLSAVLGADGGRRLPDDLHLVRPNSDAAEGSGS